MLQCDNIYKTLNLIMDSFLLLGLTPRGSCTDFFSGDEILFENYGVYVDMNLRGAKFALNMGNFRSLLYNSVSHILIVIDVKHDFRFFFISPQLFGCSLIQHVCTSLQH
jgi:hypothetical protein